jgi:hypothetical protein
MTCALHIQPKGDEILPRYCAHVLNDVFSFTLQHTPKIKVEFLTYVTQTFIEYIWIRV